MRADSRLGCLAMKSHNCSSVKDRGCPSRSMVSRVVVLRRRRDAIDEKDEVDEVDERDNKSLARGRGRSALSSRKKLLY